MCCSAVFAHDNRDFGVGGGIHYKGLLQCVLHWVCCSACFVECVLQCVCCSAVFVHDNRDIGEGGGHPL